MGTVWLNGRFVDKSNAVVSVFDRGFLYGDGVFETMRSYDGAVFALSDHLRRFFTAARVVSIRVPYTKNEIKRVVYRALKKNGLKSAYVRLSLSRGPKKPGFPIDPKAKPTIVLIAEDFKPYPAKFYEEGQRCKIVAVKRAAHSILSVIKSSNYLASVLARIEATDAGFDEGILLNTDGNVCECSTSNIFICRGRSVVTPAIASGALPGVTRENLLKIMNRLRIRRSIRNIRPEELKASDEVFITNSSIEVAPVTFVDTKKIGSGRPGPITKLLHEEYKNLVRTYIAKHSK
ncbi:MAG: branched-chain-amino-acid transaminase [Candidatus Omnitrophota bacterium]